MRYFLLLSLIHFNVMAEDRTCEKLVNQNQSMNDVYACEVQSIEKSEDSPVMSDAKEVCVGVNESTVVVAFKNAQQDLKYYLNDGKQGPVSTTFKDEPGKFSVESIEKLTLGGFRPVELRTTKLELKVLDQDSLSLFWHQQTQKKLQKKRLLSKVLARCQAQ